MTTPAFTRPTPGVPEPYRQTVEAALQRLVRLIAANTTADGALSNRVTELEDAGGGAYTDEQARDAIGAALVAGTGISISVSDVGDTITIDNTVSAVTDEHIQDVVGAMVVAGTGISVSYNDGAGTETITCSITQYTDEMARDALGAALTEGHGVDITVNDGADTITVAVDETELNYATPVAVGATLSAGSAATLVHSDHVHTISAAGFEQGTVLYEVDFSSLANNTLTAGTEVIDGLSWTVAGDTFLNTFDISNGNGLRMIAGNSLGTHSTWTSATQDSPYIYLPLSSITAWNGTSDIIVDLYISSLTLESANEYIFCAFWTVAADPHGTSSARVRKYTWIQTAGGIVPSVTINAGQTNGSEVRSGQDVMSLRMGLNTHAEGYWSTWSSGWPAQQNGTILMTTSGAIVDPMLRSSTRLVIGMGVLNDASATTRATIQRMRVRRA